MKWSCNRKCSQLLWLLGFVAAHALSARAVADARKSPCDPGLKAAGEQTVGYAKRGDRCEGIYAQEVSGGALQIVSLTRRSSNFRFAAESASLIEWPLVESQDVQVRASGLRRRLHYRMDTRRPSHPPTYTWPSEIGARLELSRNEVGVLAWTEQLVGKVNRRVFLPLRVTPAAQPVESPASAGEYSVVLMSTVELLEVYVTLNALDAEGRPGRSLRKNSRLDQGFYPAERPITFRIPFTELGGERMFSLSIGAELRNGDPRIAPEIVFLHVEPGR